MGREIRDRWHAAYVGLLAVLVCVDLLLYMPAQVRAYRGLYGITDEPRRTVQAARLHHALVIVRDANGWKDYAVLFAMNEPALDGDVVYASECPESSDQLLARYPGRTVYYYDGVEVRPYVRDRAD